jgi:adenosylcobinamide kinase/adenosylcobinamide-phosphate guanylyltransferase
MRIKKTPGSLYNPRKKDKTLIIVSNELGLGIVPNDPVSRFYRDVHGRMNQKTASFSDYAYFLISGIPVRIL